MYPIQEILSFITADGKTRAKKIQDLMNLDEVEAIRSSFVKVKTRKKEQLKGALQAVQDAEKKVAERVG